MNAFSQDAKKLFNRAFHYMSVDNIQAANLFTEVIEIDSDYAEAYYFRGIANFKLEKYYSAISDFDIAYELDSELELTNIYKGFIYRKLQETDSALLYFNKYIESNPRDTSAYSFVLRGKLRNLTGDIDGAVEDFESALELDPVQESYHYYKFIALFDDEQFDRAITEINKAIDINPEFYGYYFYRGNTYLKMEYFEKAIKEYSIALEIDVHNADIYYHRGLAFHANENYKGAIEDFDTAIAYNPYDGTYFFQRGYARLAKGDKLGACDDWFVAGSLGYYEDFQKIKDVCE